MNASTSSGKARLLFLDSLPTISGGQVVLLDLARALRGRCEMWALLPGEGSLTVQLRSIGVQCRLAPMGDYSLVRKTAADAANYLVRFPWSLLAAWRLIVTAGIHLIYANSSRTFAWGTLAAALAGRPIVWHQHNVLVDRKSLALANAVGRLPTVRRLIAASAPAAAAMPRLAARSVVVPSGIDLERFRPDRAAGRAMRRALGLPDDGRVAGLVGDLIPLKGQRTLLAAAGDISDMLPDVTFCFVGEARPDPDSQRYAQALRAEAAAANARVIFAGRQSDMPAVLNALDMLVVASTTETVPLVLLEALACGVPVLSTPVGRAPELLGDGAAGRLFPVGDATRLSELARECLAAPAQLAQMSSHARALAEQRVPLARSLDQLIAIIGAELPAHVHLR